uniref:Homeobox-containing protein n=1 Tax=Strongyloides stercoralis TaxID=6248 RepID=A0A0K0EGE4_STRER
MNNYNMIIDDKSFEMKDLIDIETSNRPTDPHFSMALCLANSVLLKNNVENEELKSIDMFESMSYYNSNNFADHVQNKKFIFEELETKQSSLPDYNNYNINNHEVNERMNYLSNVKNVEDIEKKLDDDEICYIFRPYCKDKLYHNNDNSHLETMNNSNNQNYYSSEKLEFCYTPYYHSCTSTNCFSMTNGEYQYNGNASE